MALIYSAGTSSTEDKKEDQQKQEEAAGIVTEKLQDKKATTVEEQPGQELVSVESEPSTSASGVNLPLSPKSTASDEVTTSKSIESGEIEQNEYYVSDMHPCKDTILAFVPKPHQRFPAVKYEEPLSIKATPLVEVKSQAALEELSQTLAKVTEFGIDLEHSDHGFIPITCLMQISTSDTDYIVDCLDVRYSLHLLQPVLANVNVLKIFHACNNDLKWLQQDFGLFVVNLFDTQLALEMLEGRKIGLDAELARFGVVKDKRLQKHDFRQRPLSPEIKLYARTDSHFLIAMYNKLKVRLYDANRLDELYEKCNDLCKIVHGPYRDNYFAVVDELKAFHERQLKALEKLNSWRNAKAEFKNMNSGRVLSKQALSDLIFQLPLDQQEIVRIAKSQFVNESLPEIVDILSEVNPRAAGRKQANPGPIHVPKHFQNKPGNKRKTPVHPYGQNKRFKPESFGHSRPYVEQGFMPQSFGPRLSGNVDLRATLQTNRRQNVRQARGKHQRQIRH